MILRDKDKVRLKAIFSSIKTPVEVWAFGSRVNGSAHDGSDLDLVLRTHDLQKLPFKEFAELHNKIKESNIPIYVQLFDWARIPDSFKKNIEQQYEVLFLSTDLVSA